jgi:transcriptional regulator with XRE-family HTH domain
VINPDHQDNDHSPNDDYARRLGARLRAIRTQQHLSLHGVERKSQGRWKAVVIGSYERGDRSISVHRLAELADFYGVPIGELLPHEDEPKAASSTGQPLAKVVINLARLHSVADPDATPLVRFVTSLQRMRGEYGSRSITVRVEDLHTLALVYDTSVEGLTGRLVRWQVLAPDSLILDGEP